MPDANNAINVVFGFGIGIFGITVTLFTVLYSFLLSKKSELTSLTEVFRAQEKRSPILTQKINFVNSFIEKFQNFNLHLIILCLVSFVLTLLSFFVSVFVCNIANWIIWAFIIGTILMIIYLSILLVGIYKDYKHSVKIK